MENEQRRWSRHDVLDLFTTGTTGLPRGWHEEYRDLAEFLNRGWLLLEEARFQPLPEPPETDPPTPERVAFAAAFKKGTGGQRHGWLKWWAWNWLRAHGEPAPEYECWSAHGRADVGAPGLRWLVECGDTDPGKVFTAFEAGKSDRFILFPFPDDEEHVAVVLYLSDEGKVALTRRTQERQARLREAVQHI